MEAIGGLGAAAGDLVATERACAWTLGGLLDDGQFARLRDTAERELARFATGNGIIFDMPALILTARA